MKHLTSNINFSNRLLSLLRLVLPIVALSLVMGCSKDDDSDDPKPAAKSKAAELTSFKVDGVAAEKVDGKEEFTVALPAVKALTALKVSDVKVSPKANLTTPAKANLGSVDFTTAQTFTVTAEDGTTKKSYTVTVTVPKSSDAEFTIEEAGVKSGDTPPVKVDGATVTTGTEDGTEDKPVLIAITVPSGTGDITLDYTLSEKASVAKSDVTAPASDTFSKTTPITPSVNGTVVTLEVIAEDTTTKKYYQITVKKSKSSDTTIASATIGGETATVTPPADENTNGTITVVLGADNTATLNAVEVVVTPTDSGAKVTPASPVDLDGKTVIITVTAEDDSTAKYDVTATKAVSKSSVATIASVTIGGETAMITQPANGQNGTITAVLGKTNGATLDKVPVVVTPTDSGATVTPADLTSVNLSNGAKETITVTAEDGSTTAIYDMTATKAASKSSVVTIASATIGGEDATISQPADGNNGTITAELGSTATLNAVEVVVTPTDGAAKVKPTSPASVDLDGKTVTITVTAEDGTEAKYDVTATKAAGARTDAELTFLKLSYSDGTMYVAEKVEGENKFTVTVPKNKKQADPMVLVDFKVSNGATLNIKIGDSQDYSSKNLVVTAENKTTKKTYTVMALNTLGSNDTSLTSFTIGTDDWSVSSEGTFGFANKFSVNVREKSGLKITNLVGGEGITISPKENIDFSTNPQYFTVTAEDSTSKAQYEVTATAFVYSIKLALKSDAKTQLKIGDTFKIEDLVDVDNVEVLPAGADDITFSYKFVKGIGSYYTDSELFGNNDALFEGTDASSGYKPKAAGILKLVAVANDREKGAAVSNVIEITVLDYLTSITLGGTATTDGTAATDGTTSDPLTLPTADSDSDGIKEMTVSLALPAADFDKAVAGEVLPISVMQNTEIVAGQPVPVSAYWVTTEDWKKDYKDYFNENVQVPLPYIIKNSEGAAIKFDFDAGETTGTAVIEFVIASQFEIRNGAVGFPPVADLTKFTRFRYTITITK